MTIYRADWVFTGLSEPIRHGIVEVKGGRIVRIAPRDHEHIDVDFGQSLIIPGLINAHTHLDLGELHNQLPPPAQFTDWLKQVISYRMSTKPETWDAAIREGISQSLQSGIMHLGDISVGGRSASLLQQASCRAHVYFELIGLTDERTDQALLQADTWLTSRHDNIIHALSPHAPYSVSRRLLTTLRDKYPHVPVAMHVAETREELQLLETHQGPFKEFLQSINAWQPDNLFRSIDEVIDVLNGFDQAYLIHGNYLNREQWQKLGNGITVVYCPRTHAYFGHDTHPYLEMLADGVKVALGTDSLASNPDLNVLNECRFLWKRDKSRLNGNTLLNLVSKPFIPGSLAHFVVFLHNNCSNDPWELLWGYDSELKRLLPST